MGFIMRRLSNLRNNMARNQSVKSQKSRDSTLNDNSKTEVTTGVPIAESVLVSETEAAHQHQELETELLKEEKEAIEIIIAEPVVVPSIEEPEPVVEELPKPVIDVNKVIYAGHISLLRKGFVDWRSYWVSVRHGKIYVYKCAEQEWLGNSTPVRIIDLTHCVAVERERHADQVLCMQWALRIELIQEGVQTTVFMNAETREEMKEFIDAVRVAAGLVKSVDNTPIQSQQP
eukprot:Colp12_sorted_trinity150504_noHs@6887